MRLKKIKIENYKSIKSMNVNFDGNVFLVKGDNEKGKTTFCRSFLKLVTTTDKAEIPVTEGQAHGTIEGVFVDANDNRYTVILDFTNDKETIRMITPEGVSTSKVGEIKNFFNYSYVDVDEFISWSSTAEGRRKQRDIVLKLLSENEISKFNDANVREAENYKKRTDANRELDVAIKIYETSKVTTEDITIFDDYKNIETTYNLIKEKKDNALKIKADYTILENSIVSKSDERTRLVLSKSDLQDESIKDKNSLLLEITNLENQIALKKKTLGENTMSYATKINKVENEIVSVDLELDELDKKKKAMSNGDPKDIEDQFIKAETEFNQVKKIEEHKTQAETNLKTLEEKKKVYNNLSTTIEAIRKEKETIILESSIPIKGLTIDDDGILLNNLPFTKEQLSTSQIITTVFKILIALNKKTPIFYLGRAESLGKAKLDEMLQIAIDNNYQVFVDRVESGEELKIEVYEDLTNKELI